jgi:hypothetical protein
MHIGVQYERSPAVEHQRRDTPRLTVLRFLDTTGSRARDARAAAALHAVRPD